MVTMMMNEHSFAFIVSGIDFDDDSFADRFYEAGCSDATLMLVNGLLAVCFAREAESFAHAVLSGYADIAKTGSKVERFEPDFLVSKAEIAKRANLSRAAVSLYVSGDRGQGFPSPHARITSSSPLWDWVEVSAWLHQNDLLPVDEVVKARISRAVNRAVQDLAERVHDSDKHVMRMVADVAREPVFGSA